MKQLDTLLFESGATAISSLTPKSRKNEEGGQAIENAVDVHFAYQKFLLHSEMLSACLLHGNAFCILSSKHTLEKIAILAERFLDACVLCLQQEAASSHSSMFATTSEAASSQSSHVSRRPQNLSYSTN
jgi:hypothetical protein